MLAIDTNILVYAHRSEMPLHSQADDMMRQITESRAPWGLPVPCISEFLRVVTHLRAFENPSSMRHLLRECSSSNIIKYWIGEQLEPYSKKGRDCTVLATPYHINQSAVGAIAILGPTRIPYKQLFATLRLFSTYVSEALTKDVYKYKINYREAEHEGLYLEREERNIIQQSDPMLLENKSQ